MKKTISKLFDPLFVIVFWFALFALPLIFHWINNPGINWNFILKIWSDYLPLLIIFIVNRVVLIKSFLYKSKPLLYILSVVALITITVIGTQQLTQQKKNPPNDYGMLRFSTPNQAKPMGRFNRHKPPQGAYPSYVNLILLSFLLVGFDTGTKLSVKWARTERQKAELEKENIKNELAFLRNQISPHFLMNTLNNIHSLADFDVKEAKSSIARLSILMRHLLYESDENPTALTKEIKFIESYIKLMQLRFTDDVEVRLELPKNIPDISIPPLLFTNILENAFKYGISYNDKSFVHIIINCTDINLEFSVRNSIHKRSLDTKNKGIGIVNTQKRLQLLYNQNYIYTYSEMENVFSAIIKIPI